jgi:hypothetical protein
VYALQNCVSWVAFDVGELARCEQPHMGQLQVSLARRMTVALCSGPTESLNHKVISPVLARRGLFYPLPLEITGLAGSWGE